MEQKAQEKENQEKESQLIEHEIEVNNYVSVRLKIPKKLDALELKSLSTMSTKLLNLSQVTDAKQLPSREPRRMLRNQEQRVEVLKEFLKAENKQERQVLADKHGVPLKRYCQRMHNLKYNLKKAGVEI